MNFIKTNKNLTFSLWYKTLTIVLPVLMVMSLFCCQVLSSDNILQNNEMKKVDSFENGVLYQCGKIKVVKLNGTYKEMGRQYGKLLSKEINGMYNEIIKQYTKNKKIGSDENLISSEKELIDFSINLFKLYPKRFLDIADGMSETSGIDTDKLAAINEAFDYFLSSLPGLSKDGNHCSGIAVWGDYTGGGPLVMGRNFDFPTFYRNFSPYLVIVVFNPIDGSNSVATITYAGQVSAIQAFNNCGIVLENNDGSNCGDKNRYFGERTPFLVKDLEMAFDYSSIEGIDGALKTNRIHHPLIFNIATPDAAYSYEMTTSDVKRRSGENGLLIGINHFVNPEWPAPTEGALSYIDDSVMRYNNLVTLAEKYRGHIDDKKMMEILDVPQDKGGATPSEKSIYQFVTVPGELKLWIKAYGYMDWTEIELKELFH